jgi:hypothetical protein
MNSLYIDGKRTLYEIGRDEGNAARNGLAVVFIKGASITGRLCRIRRVFLPAGIVERGGTCKANGKTYSIRSD